MKIKKTGFTLIELLVSLTIMAIIMGLALVAFQSSRKTARDARRKTDLEEIRSALEMCRADTGSYPATGSFSFGGALTCGSNNYLSPVPLDPVQSGVYYYTYARLTTSTYSLCANQLEVTGLTYCVTNP